MSKKLPEGWKECKLGDVGKIHTGNTPLTKNEEFYSSNDIMFVKPDDFIEGKINIINTSKAYLSNIGAKKGRFIPKGSLLVTCIGILGKVGIIEKDCCFNQQINAIVPNRDIVIPEYMAYYILKNRYTLDSMASGAVVPMINKTQFSNIKIYLPPLEEQKRIVSILERAEDAIRKRQESNRLLDELVKSKFIEMFGDPITNLNNWDIETIGSVVKSITAGWSVNGESRVKMEDEKAVLKVSAVTQGCFKSDEYKVIDKDVEIKKYVFPEQGDLLFSRANTRELVGATCIIHKDYPDLLLPDKLWKILFVDRVNVFYMKYILSESSIRAKFSANSTGTSGSMYNVSMDKFKNIEIPVPPREIQDRFADFVKQVDKLKFKMENSLEELKNNFNSLMQRAFNGEL